MGKEGKIMKAVRTIIVAFLCVFAILLQTSYAQEVRYPSFAIEHTIDPKYKKEGAIFSEGWGQCVGFVRRGRGDFLKGISIPTAAAMPEIAEKNGIEVNNLPREGAILVVPGTKVLPFGHVAIVTKVEETKTDGVYTLTIMDANSRHEVWRHVYKDGKRIFLNKRGEVVQGSTVDKRSITFTYFYDLKGKKRTKITDKAYRDPQFNIVFIHEKKVDYKAKRAEALGYVTDVFKRLLGRDMSDKEKEDYVDKLMMMTVTTQQQLEATVRKLPEYEQRIAAAPPPVTAPPVPTVVTAPPPTLLWIKPLLPPPIRLLVEGLEPVIAPLIPLIAPLISPPPPVVAPPPAPVVTPLFPTVSAASARILGGEIEWIGTPRAIVNVVHTHGASMPTWSGSVSGTAAVIQSGFVSGTFNRTILEGGHYRLDMSGSYAWVAGRSEAPSPPHVRLIVTPSPPSVGAVITVPSSPPRVHTITWPIPFPSGAVVTSAKVVGTAHPATDDSFWFLCSGRVGGKPLYGASIGDILRDPANPMRVHPDRLWDGMNIGWIEDGLKRYWYFGGLSGSYTTVFYNKDAGPRVGISGTFSTSVDGLFWDGSRPFWEQFSKISPTLPRPIRDFMPVPIPITKTALRTYDISGSGILSISDGLPRPVASGSMHTSILGKEIEVTPGSGAFDVNVRGDWSVSGGNITNLTDIEGTINATTSITGTTVFPMLIDGGIKPLDGNTALVGAFVERHGVLPPPVGVVTGEVGIMMGKMTGSTSGTFDGKAFGDVSPGFLLP